MTIYSGTHAPDNDNAMQAFPQEKISHYTTGAALN